MKQQQNKHRSIPFTPIAILRGKHRARNLIHRKWVRFSNTIINAAILAYLLIFRPGHLYTYVPYVYTCVEYIEERYERYTNGAKAHKCTYEQTNFYVENFFFIILTESQSVDVGNSWYKEFSRCLFVVVLFRKYILEVVFLLNANEKRKSFLNEKKKLIQSKVKGKQRLPRNKFSVLKI